MLAVACLAGCGENWPEWLRAEYRDTGNCPSQSSWNPGKGWRASGHLLQMPELPGQKRSLCVWWRDTGHIDDSELFLFNRIPEYSEQRRT